MSFSEATRLLAQKTILALSGSGRIIVTAESCTGGLVAAALTQIPGASNVVYGGFVTYANQAKEQMLNLSGDLLQTYGAVSQQVAEAMAKKALENSGADISVAITGIAGPDGGTTKKPVGLVYIAVATANSDPEMLCREFRFGDQGRALVREASVQSALELVMEKLQAQE